MSIIFRAIFILLYVSSIFLSGCFSQNTHKYVFRGCYEFNPRSSLLSDASKNFNSSVLDSCINFCRQKNYIFAGVEQQECRCGNHVPSSLLKRSNSECYHPCQGHTLLKCGGKSKVSVYDTGNKISELIPSRIYLGCFKDANPEFRVLKGSYNVFSQDNTPDKCHNHCFKSGFRYFGLTYMHECFCGDTIPSLTDVLPESECDSRCSGNPKEICGGGWRLSIYSTGITDYPEVGRYRGCFKNFRNSEIKLEYKMELPKSNTNRRCLNMCYFKGYKYSGVENKTTCICMDFPPLSIFMDEVQACEKIDCPGDITQKCGSTNRVKVYQTRHADVASHTEVRFRGCYEDRVDFRILNGYQVTIDEDLSPKLCADICKKKEFLFAGVEAGNECFCSHTYPSRSLRTAEADCTIPCSGIPNEMCGGFLRLAVYETGLPYNQARTSSHYLGCYRDDNREDRLLKGSWQQLENNSPAVCHKLCLKTGFAYFGLTYIKECFCGDESPPSGNIVPEEECNKECGGDSNKKCGGGWRLSFYKTGLENLNDDEKYLGCFPDDKTTLLDYFVTLYTSNNPNRCTRICDQMGYLYAGVQRGNECRCGNTQPKYFAEEDGKCNIKCSAAGGETCGGDNHIKLYRTTVQDAKKASIFENTRSGKCKISDTTKNGKYACKYEIIFEENFNNLNSSTWKHTIKMASDPDYEFVTYSSSSKNVFVKNGILNIAPILQPENYVHGKETLTGCTGKPNSAECTKIAESYVILPPVLSGQIMTKHSFSFRFGRVDIKAKLPSGDWIIPQIWLEPKENIYGPKYTSGQIKIAMVRGNKNLTCDGVNLGSKNLETGILVGPSNSVQKIITRNDSADDWSTDFHNFSLLWTTDNLSFYVDGEFVSKILKNPSDSIFNTAKLPKNYMSLWQEGTNLAPFDKEFYITLGVSVGGIRDFTDSCLSDGIKKPWSNTSPKAMYHFWSKQKEWSATWKNSNSNLQVDYIKVAAL